MLESIALVNGLSQKMDFLQVRQRVLSQNITNADTPGYASLDVKKPDFSKTLGRYTNRLALQEGEKIGIAKTSSAHFDRRQLLNRAETGDAVRQPYEIAPAKNAVSLEEQMINASQTAVDYQLVTNLYNKNLDLIRAAIR